MTVGLQTLILLIIFFAAAGVGVFIYERVKGAKDDNLRQRYFSWYIIAPVVLLPAYFGGLPFALLVLGLALYCLREFFEVTHVRKTHAYKWIGRACGLLIIITAIYRSGDPGPPFDVLMPIFRSAFGSEPLFGTPLFYVLPIFVIMMVLLVPIGLGSFEGMLTKQCVTIFGILYFGWFLGHLILLRQLSGGFGYLVFLCATVVLNDVLAYTAGRLWGKTKLAPHISPKKTWEGALGGVGGSLLGAVVFKYAVPDLALETAILAGIVIGITAPLGDLIVSVIKRDMAVKDSGDLIPGHGGLLDRCDSLIFATPAFYYFLLFTRHIHH